MGEGPDAESFRSYYTFPRRLANRPGSNPESPFAGQESILTQIKSRQHACQGEVHFLGRVVSPCGDLLADAGHQREADGAVPRLGRCAGLAQSLADDRATESQQPGRKMRALQTRARTVLKHRLIL